MPTPITAVLDKKMITLAEQWQQMIYDSGLRDSDNYTRLSEPDRFKIGYLGELGTVQVMRNLGILCQHRVVSDGNAQTSEIVAFQNGARVSIDAKTAAKPYYKELMYPAAQTDIPDVYVGARIEHLTPKLCIVSVHGWVTAEDMGEIKPTMVKILTKSKPLATLRPMVSLWESLDKSDLINEGGF